MMMTMLCDKTISLAAAETWTRDSGSHQNTAQVATNSSFQSSGQDQAYGRFVRSFIHVFCYSFFVVRINIKRTHETSLQNTALPDLSSVDFVIVCFLMKLYNTTNMDIINNCQQYFDVKLPSTLWSDRVRRSVKTFAECDNIFCKILVSVR